MRMISNNNMNKYHETWWKEEVNETFQILKKYIYLSMAIIVAACLFCLLLVNSSISIFVIQAPFIVIHSCTFLILPYLENKNAILKAISSIAYAELSGISLFYQARHLSSEHRILIEMHAVLIVKHLELPFIKSFWLRNLIYGRHVFLWYYIKYYYGELSFAENFSMHMTTVYVLIIFNLISYYRLKSSFERFLYRKEQEAAENRLGVIMSAYPGGILVISSLEKIEYCNSTMLNLLSCTYFEIFPLLEGVQYSKDKKFSNITNSNKLIDDIQILFGSETNHEVMLGISVIGENSIEWKAIKVLWEDKFALIIYARNANQIIQLEQTISENKIKTVLLRSVSHELRTPINAISFLVHDLIEDVKIILAKSHLKKLKMISVSSKLLLSLVNDLLDYSRMLAGVFAIQKSRVSLKEVISSTCDLIRIQAIKKGLGLGIRIDPMLPEYIYTDPFRLSQILLNLLSNALKFTMKGQIDISCISTKENKLKISVRDTGLGIRAEKLQNLFEEFNTENIPNINPQGCGLGLHISNRLIKALGNGTINVVSQFGKGSMFSFTIDINEENNSPADLSIISNEKDSLFDEENQNVITVKQFFTFHEGKTQSPKVLIADDNDFNRIIIGTLLKRNGILFDEACNGKEAVDKIALKSSKEKQYSVVIMDCNMPELNGWEASKKICTLYSEGRLCEKPTIIGHSAYSSAEDISLCYQSGMAEVLVKPCSPEEILGTIKKYLTS
ncbi:unnamed protein product [Blepharisma stoltei]|uniref:histidine kinase n=1 Tax=Blepharisma stoltei TaxID=1481888 RepID=A0AAU9JV58_9CILI|nr:unnamed protein product [Blepharisma stoltei]